MSDDAEIDVKFGELGGADLSSECAVIKPEAVLGAKFDSGSSADVSDFGDCEEWRADDDVDIKIFGGKMENFVD